MEQYTADQLNGSVLGVRVAFEHRGLKVSGVLEKVRHEYEIEFAPGMFGTGSKEPRGVTTLSICQIDGEIAVPVDLPVSVFRT